MNMEKLPSYESVMKEKYTIKLNGCKKYAIKIFHEYTLSDQEDEFCFSLISIENENQDEEITFEVLKYLQEYSRIFHNDDYELFLEKNLVDYCIKIYPKNSNKNLVNFSISNY